MSVVTYSARMHPVSAAERVRLRLKEELKARDISQRELAEALTKQSGEFWSQPKVAKILAGHVELKVDDADAIAKVAGIFLSEAVRDRGLEFYAEMTPTELRVLEGLRKRRHLWQAALSMLDLLSPSNPSEPVRKSRKVGRPTHASRKKLEA